MPFYYIEMTKKLWKQPKRKKIFKILRQRVTKINKHKVEKEHLHFDWQTIWTNYNHIRDLKKKSKILEYIHDAWWTQEKAHQRKIIPKIPACPICRQYSDTKIHIILNCTGLQNHRLTIINKIRNTTGNFTNENILYTHGIQDKNLYNQIINFILTAIDTRRLNISIPRAPSPRRWNYTYIGTLPPSP